MGCACFSLGLLLPSLGPSLATGSIHSVFLWPHHILKGPSSCTENMGCCNLFYDQDYSLFHLLLHATSFNFYEKQRWCFLSNGLIHNLIFIMFWTLVGMKGTIYWASLRWQNNPSVFLSFTQSSYLKSCELSNIGETRSLMLLLTYSKLKILHIM